MVPIMTFPRTHRIRNNNSSTIGLVVVRLLLLGWVHSCVWTTMTASSSFLSKTPNSVRATTEQPSHRANPWCWNVVTTEDNHDTTNDTNNNNNNNNDNDNHTNNNNNNNDSIINTSNDESVELSSPVRRLELSSCMVHEKEHDDDGNDDDDEEETMVVVVVAIHETRTHILELSVHVGTLAKLFLQHAPLDAPPSPPPTTTTSSTTSSTTTARTALDQTPFQTPEIQTCMRDILHRLQAIAASLSIDWNLAILKKMELNRRKYPKELCQVSEVCRTSLLNGMEGNWFLRLLVCMRLLVCVSLSVCTDDSRPSSCRPSSAGKGRKVHRVLECDWHYQRSGTIHFGMELEQRGLSASFAADRCVGGSSAGPMDGSHP